MVKMVYVMYAACVTVTLLSNVHCIYSLTSEEKTEANRTGDSSDMPQVAGTATKSHVQKATVRRGNTDLSDMHLIAQPCCKVNHSIATCTSNNSYLTMCLSDLQVDISELTLILRNRRYGQFHPMDEPIDLHLLEKFRNLRKFRMQMSPDEKTVIKPNTLVYSKDTFSVLTRITSLSINIPLANNTDLATIVKHLASLEHLDISRTVTVASVNIRTALYAINKFPIKTLCMSNFQTIGAFGYSQSLNISSFFGPAKEEPSLTHLDLSHNYLGLLLPSFSIMFPNLTVLDISYNMLILNHNAPVFIDIFLHENLEIINIGNQGYRFEEHFDLDDHVPSYIPHKLHSFYTIMAPCINLVTNGNVSGLLENNTLFCVTITCILKQIIRNFEHLSIPCYLFGRFGDLYKYDCLLMWRLPFFKRAKYLNADNLNWIVPEGYNLSGNLCFQNTQLMNFSFRNNNYWFQNQYIAQSFNSFSDIQGFDKVEYIDLSGNEGTLEFPLTIPTTYDHLKNFQMAKNRVTFKNVSICNHAPNVVVLNIRQNRLTDSELPDGVVHNCTELEILDLSYNYLAFDSTTLDLTGNNKLQVLNFSFNDILILPMELQNGLNDIAEFQRRVSGSVKVQVLLIGNPLQCVCSEVSLSFAEWLVRSNVRMKMSSKMLCYIGEYIYILNEQVDNLNVLKRDCSHTGVIIKSVVLTAGSALFLFMVSMAYLLRWKIRYNLYKITEKLRGFCSTEHETVQSESWKYDVFVSYCADDRFWVHDVLMKQLENKYRFKLCIHFRDFPLGETICNAIIQAIEVSKDFIIVVSEKSVTRPWCQLELETAFREAQKRGIKLVVIKLEDFVLPEDNLTIRWIMKNQVYLQWSDHPDAQKLFWKKLVNHLYGKSYQCCCLNLGDYNNVKAMDYLNPGSQCDRETEPLLPIL